MVDVYAAVRRRHGLADVKLVLITNASLLHRPRVRRGWPLWTPMAGKSGPSSMGHGRLLPARGPVDRALAADSQQSRRGGPSAADGHPVAVDADWRRAGGSPAELAAFCDRLQEIPAAGGKIKLVQVHTVARKPAEAAVAALSRAEVDAIAELVPGPHRLAHGGILWSGRRGTNEAIVVVVGCASAQRMPKGASVMLKHNRLWLLRCTVFLLPMPKFWPDCDVFYGRSSAGPFRSS